MKIIILEIIALVVLVAIEVNRDHTQYVYGFVEQQEQVQVESLDEAYELGLVPAPSQHGGCTVPLTPVATPTPYPRNAPTPTPSVFGSIEHAGRAALSSYWSIIRPEPELPVEFPEPSSNCAPVQEVGTPTPYPMGMATPTPDVPSTN